MIAVYQESERQDVYSKITNTIISSIEQGTGTVQLPWHREGGAFGRPRNAHTGKPYSGVNVLSLWAASERRGYSAPYWATYRQWQLLDAQVRKGERGSPVVLYKQLEDREADETGTDGPAKRRFFARSSTVFNASQVDGYSLPEAKPRSLVEIIEGAERFVASTGATIRHGGDRAFYQPREDYIGFPNRERFVGTSTSSATESYYAVLFHELTHWTGHEKRLNRNLTNRFGDQAYAMEELVAELGAAFLCADIGVTNSPRPDHAAYVANWLSVMANDTRAIFSAASKASQATDYLQRSEQEMGKADIEKQPKEAEDIPF